MAFTPSLTYKGRPLVRCGNDIYYGSMHDPYVVYLQVLTTKKEGNADVADKVHIVLLSTDESKPLPARIVRQANKAGGLFNALTFGDIMLRNQLKNEKVNRNPQCPVRLDRAVFVVLHPCAAGRCYLTTPELLHH